MSLLINAYFIKGCNVRLLLGSHLFRAGKLFSEHGVVLLNALSNGALTFNLGHNRAEMLQLNLVRGQATGLEVLGFWMGLQGTLCSDLGWGLGGLCALLSGRA